jgi:hypothetical protein
MRTPIALLAALACSLSACASTGKGMAGDTMRMTRHGMGAAVMAPLHDFNLVRQKVPAALAAAAEDPYRRPEPLDCETLVREVTELDRALGPDMDTPRTAGRMSLSSRGADALSNASLDAVRDLTTGWIPFRGVVRRLTGAEQNKDAMEDAVQAGAVRRAYLKGLGLERSCPHPASPLSGAGLVVAGDAADTATIAAATSAE